MISNQGAVHIIAAINYCTMECYCLSSILHKHNNDRKQLFFMNSKISYNIFVRFDEVTSGGVADTLVIVFNIFEDIIIVIVALYNLSTPGLTIQK